MFLAGSIIPLFPNIAKASPATSLMVNCPSTPNQSFLHLQLF
jgi:hypothetical protein